MRKIGGYMGISRHHTSRHIIPQTSRRTGVPSIAYFDEPAARGVRAASKAAVTAAVSVMPINERLPNERTRCRGQRLEAMPRVRRWRSWPPSTGAASARSGGHLSPNPGRGVKCADRFRSGHRFDRSPFLAPPLGGEPYPPPPSKAPSLPTCPFGGRPNLI